MPFKAVFVAVVIGTALVITAFLVNARRPRIEATQNGFFRWVEWVPVASASLAVGFLVVALARPREAAGRVAYGVLVLQGVVGVLGFGLHVKADVARRTLPLGDRFVFGAPAFAPLLFADLAALAAIGLWALSRNPGNRPSRTITPSSNGLPLFRRERGHDEVGSEGGVGEPLAGRLDGDHPHP
jgi:hypothetical protein